MITLQNIGRGAKCPTERIGKMKSYIVTNMAEYMEVKENGTLIRNEIFEPDGVRFVINLYLYNGGVYAVNKRGTDIIYCNRLA